MFGELKVVDGLFLGKEELTRLQQYMIDKVAFLLKQGGYGFLDDNSFEVTQGTVAGTVKIEESVAIDKDGNIIFKELQNDIQIPTNKVYWLAVSQLKSPVEEGTVSLQLVSSTGSNVVSGIGTKFLSLLRGNSSTYRQLRVKFSRTDNETLINDQIYLVKEVISDTEMTLLDPIAVESGLKYSVVGSFSQDVIPVTDDKFCYNNYRCELKLAEETTLNTVPPELGVDEEYTFLIARITNNNGTITIEDQRQTFYNTIVKLIRPNDWEVLLLNVGFVQDDDNPLSIRRVHFSNLIEIKGIFTSMNATGVIATIPEIYRPVLNDCVVHFYKDGGAEDTLLSIKENGEITLLGADSTYATGGIKNIVYSQLYGI